VRIAPHYDGPVVYVPDASRSVGVAQGLLGEQAAKFVADLRADYEQVRQRHAKRQQTPLWPLPQARANATRIDWAAWQPPAPKFTGRRVIHNIPLADLVPFIDWTPFFQTWDLHGKYPAIFDDETVGAQARRVYDDAQKMLAQITQGRWLTASAVIGFWPANTVRQDDIELYTDESRAQPVLTWYGLRQQTEKQPDAQDRMRPSRCLADFIAPRGQQDYLGAFAVTAGLGVDVKEAEFLTRHDDYNAIMLKSLADRLAEAAAEWLHRRARTDWWGYAADESLTNDQLIAEQYRGIRPAPGYPACPDHRVKKPLFHLLGAHDIGMTLTDSYAMSPAASVSGFYFSHPEATYFNVGKIGPDQALDLAERSGAPADEVERALAPNLNL
jgi:5-methyltetrahydrofolate--homocysteine methyltransferase